MPEPARLPYRRRPVWHWLIASALALAVIGCVHTEPFTDASGKPVAGSIATMESILINGVDQQLWFRGSDVTHPALILLHGGPGASESALFRHYDAALERHFLVVYWEQRGAGRSYHGDIAPQSMTIAQFERDLDRVVDLVRQRFHKNQVVLLGHSWGAVLGTRYAAAHPDKVSAYVAVAPMVDKAPQDRLSWQFAVNEASRRGDRSAIDKLRDNGPTPRTVDDELALGDLVERFGGTFYENRLSTGKLIRAALGTDEASLIDLIKFGRGNRFSLESLWAEFSTVDLTGYRKFAMPVFFLLGRHDWHVPAVVSAQYFETIEAPCKRLVWFEQSGHNPPFEEPARFISVMVDSVLPAVGEQGCSQAPGEKLEN